MKSKKRSILILLVAVFVILAGISYAISFRVQSEDETIVQAKVSSEETDLVTTKEQTDNTSSSDLTEESVGDQVELTGEEDTSGMSTTEEEDSNKVFSEETESVTDVTSSEQEALLDAENIYVHMCGAVKNPGVYEVSQGSRVIDVVELAGGFLEDAAEDYVNLAQAVFDGEQIIIPDQTEVAEINREDLIQSVNGSNQNTGTNTAADSKSSVNESGTTSSEDTSSSLININTASKEELMTLSGVGEAKADLIINYRENEGSFTTIEDIMKISGIKEGLFNKICDFITVE